MLGKPEIVKNWAGKEQNVYRRELLYQEVWNYPVTEVAKKYAVSDAAIHKVCRSMDIPTPPVGYWAKKQAGKDITIPPLPPSDCCSMKFGLRTQGQTPLPAGNHPVVMAVGLTPNAITEEEEAVRKQREEKQRLEERRKRYNLEVEKTKALLNQAEDYDTACKIRAMVAAAKQKGTATAEWIAWANAKADWYDPIVAAKDM